MISGTRASHKEQKRFLQVLQNVLYYYLYERQVMLEVFT